MTSDKTGKNLMIVITELMMIGRRLDELCFYIGETSKETITAFKDE